LDFAEFARLLQGTQAFEGWVEEKQQYQGGVIVEEETSIAGPVSFGTLVMQHSQERLKLPEVFDPLNIFGFNWRFGPPCHVRTCKCRLSKWRIRAPDPPISGLTSCFHAKRKKNGEIQRIQCFPGWAIVVPNSIGPDPFFYLERLKKRGQESLPGTAFGASR
jgi:hypothetical protein